MWAVIDIGSNTIRLVIYSVEQGQPHSMLNKKYAVGLAGYVDASNRICKEGIAVLLEALSDIHEILECIHPERVLPFGTATLRNTANGKEIVAMIREEIGMDVRVLTGEEEAIFDYYGALQDGIGNSGLLVDVGGGSTELTFFQNHKIVAATSFPLGSLNLYKTYVDKLLPTEKEARQIKKAVKHCLAQITLPDQELTTQPIYSVGGTARAALKLMQEKFALGDVKEFTLLQLKSILADSHEAPKEFLHWILRVSPDRIHTIVPGLLIFQTIAKTYHSLSFVTSRYGVREGYLMQQLKEKNQ